MIRVKPPAPGYKYNGANVPLEGIDVEDYDAEALEKAGWKIEKPKPKKKEASE